MSKCWCDEKSIPTEIIVTTKESYSKFAELLDKCHELNPDHTLWPIDRPVHSRDLQKHCGMWKPCESKPSRGEKRDILLELNLN